MCLPLLALALSAAQAQAAPVRLDHRGAVGLLLASGGDLSTSAGSGTTADPQGRVPLELGGTLAIGDDGNELKLLGRAELGRASPSWAASFGYRGYFGDERIKTFFDLDLRADLAPALTLGPRLGFGVQYELGSLVGLFAGLGAHVGAGAGVRFGGELLLGVQLRSYLLE